MFTQNTWSIKLRSRYVMAYYGTFSVTSHGFTFPYDSSIFMYSKCRLIKCVPHVLLFQLWFWQVLPACVWIHPCEVQRGGPAVGLSPPGLGLHPVTGRRVTQENLQVCGESPGSLCLQSGPHSHPQQDLSPRSLTSFETWVKAAQAQVCSVRQLLQVYWTVDFPTEYLSDKVSLFQVT